jgi:hypothetical protein
MARVAAAPAFSGDVSQETCSGNNHSGAVRIRARPPAPGALDGVRGRARYPNAFGLREA